MKPSKKLIAVAIATYFLAGYGLAAVGRDIYHAVRIYKCTSQASLEECQRYLK